MSRLIDADKLIKVLNDMPYIKGRYDKVNGDEKFIFGCETVYEIVINMLEEQPTAYDVDKVVKELEELKASAFDDEVVIMREAIEIVKAGGIDE